jgi:hypothetical protein
MAPNAKTLLKSSGTPALTLPSPRGRGVYANSASTARRYFQTFCTEAM